MKNKGLRQGVFHLEDMISSQGRYDHFDTAPGRRNLYGQGNKRASAPMETAVSIPAKAKKVKPRFQAYQGSRYYSANLG